MVPPAGLWFVELTEPNVVPSIVGPTLSIALALAVPLSPLFTADVVPKLLFVTWTDAAGAETVVAVALPPVAARLLAEVAAKVTALMLTVAPDEAVIVEAASEPAPTLVATAPPMASAENPTV